MLLIVGGIGVASAQQCSSSITMCGCTISKSGVYSVDADLSAIQGLTSRHGCIDVSADNVKLFTNGHAITGAGNGTGVAIHVLSSADDVLLEAGTSLGTSCCHYTTLSGWQYGIESEANHVTTDGFFQTGNTTGILLNGARKNVIANFMASHNSVYGLWINGGSENKITDASANSNGVAGVYLGCSSTGPAGKACTRDADTSDGNTILHLVALSENYGIVVEKGSTANTIASTWTHDNTVADLFDGHSTSNWWNNGNDNVWRINGFTTANQSYIH
jgi:parallel beta-helix repeat protein